MTDGVINHQFGSIFGSLDDIQGGINALNEIRDNTDKAFGALLNSGAFEGQAADRVRAVQQQHSQKVQEHIGTMQQIHGQATQQQYDTQSLDARLAGGIG